MVGFCIKFGQSITERVTKVVPIMVKYKKNSFISAGGQFLKTLHLEAKQVFLHVCTVMTLVFATYDFLSVMDCKVHIAENKSYLNLSGEAVRDQSNMSFGLSVMNCRIDLSAVPNPKS